MSEQSRDYDAELATLLETTRKHSGGLSLPNVPPIKDDVTPTLTWVGESSDGRKSIRNAHS